MDIFINLYTYAPILHIFTPLNDTMTAGDWHQILELLKYTAQDDSTAAVILIITIIIVLICRSDGKMCKHLETM